MRGRGLRVFYLRSLSGMGIRWIRVNLSNGGWSCLLTDSTSSFPWGWCKETRLRPGTAAWVNSRSSITKCQVWGETSRSTPLLQAKARASRTHLSFLYRVISWEIPWKARLLEVFGLEAYGDFEIENTFIFDLHVPCKQTDLYQNSPKGIRIQLSCSL